MRELKNKTNIIAPGGDYPYGRLKDNPGNNTGTPVDENLLGDASQFFEKIMAESGITPNNLPENSAAGFQLFDALKKVIEDNTYTPVWSKSTALVPSYITNLSDVWVLIDKNSLSLTIFTTLLPNSPLNSGQLVLGVPIPSFNPIFSQFDFSIMTFSGTIISLRARENPVGSTKFLEIVAPTGTPADAFSLSITIPF